MLMISSAAIENIRSATYISDAFVFMNKDIEAFNLKAIHFGPNSKYQC